MTQSTSTEEFIRALADRPVPVPFSPAITVVAAALAAAVGLALFYLAFGLRPDVAAALVIPAILGKSALPLGLAALAVWLALQSARPEVTPPLWLLAAPVGVGAVLFAARFAQTPPGAVLPELIGQTAMACLVSVTTLSAAPLALGLGLLRRGASTRPGLTGALMGIGTGAAIAAGYALHCTEDSPLFFTTWYGLAILLCGLAGGLAGGRMLRW